MSGTKRAAPTRPGFLTRLRACRRGSGTIEFAFAAPILLLGVMGVIEFGMVLFMNALIEGGVREASRFGITGYAPVGLSREEMIVQEITNSTLGLVKPEDITITTIVYGDFTQIGMEEPFVDSAPVNGTYDLGEEYVDVNGNGQWDADMGTAGVGGPGDVVVYEVAVDWPLMTTYLAPLIGTDGKMPLTASIAVRNEPY